MQPIETMTLADWLNIFKRHRLIFFLTATGIFLAAVLIAFAMPAVYRSEATIMIEAQEVPSDFVTSTVTSFAEQRIQTIEQQIMSYTSLLEIINTHDPYPELKDKASSEEIVAKMRSDTLLKPLSAEILDTRTGRATQATIAFNLSFQGKNPRKVQEITNVLVSLYMEKNIAERVQQVEETSAFLRSESERIKKELSVIEGRVAQFKQAHINQLPEMLQVNMQSLNNVDRNMEAAKQEMRSLKERESYLRAQLAGLQPYVKDESEIAARQRLETLKIELVALTKRFTDEYPDVVKTRAEIEEFESKLAALESGKKGAPDNPVYVSMMSQLAAVKADIRSTQQQIDSLASEADEYQRRVVATPNVEEAYSQLLMLRNSTQAKYNDLMNKLLESQIAHGLEAEQKGERFSLLESPRLPRKPFKPNRLAIVVVGVVLAIFAGGGLVLAIAYFDDRIYSPDLLSHVTGLPMLTGVPLILTDRDLLKRRNWRIAAVGAAVVLIVAGLVAIHFTMTDLDLVVMKLLRRLDLSS
ncbi:lipopolysaccharide biosynthesis protein [Desulfosarcina variabilis str. Montpellier]|uniref:GumC family protein n=1 Tax=Desulfosarcina variabilis TaxID=2300 RepID=UPI003AFB2EBB